MIGKIKIAVFVIGLACFEAGFTRGGPAAEEGGQAGYQVQAADGPARAGQRPPEAASPPSQDKTGRKTEKEEKPAAPSKSGPLKPFVPTEKVRADQALDFPADI
jgi:hypothetical protein